VLEGSKQKSDLTIKHLGCSYFVRLSTSTGIVQVNSLSFLSWKDLLPHEKQAGQLSRKAESDPWNSMKAE
jgi:hypothetical protein